MSTKQANIKIFDNAAIERKRESDNMVGEKSFHETESALKTQESHRKWKRASQRRERGASLSLAGREQTKMQHVRCYA